MSKVMQVLLTKLDNEIVQHIVGCCNFCNKRVQLESDNYKTCLSLGHGRFYCSFCLRNRFNYKMKKHVLLMDFHGIIGFLLNYLYPEKKIWRAQINNYVRNHTKIGLENPAFTYDYESLSWFVDFTRIGTTKHKIPYTLVLETTDKIIDCFELHKHTAANMQNLKDKYKDAIEIYYTQRQRPEGKRILSPTLKGCLWRSEPDWWEESKYFDIEDISDMKLVAAPPIQNIKLYSEDLQQPTCSNLTVNVKQKRTKDAKGWEGSINIPGLAPTKLITRKGASIFTKRTSLNSAARSLAKKLGVTINFQRMDP